MTGDVKGVGGGYAGHVVVGFDDCIERKGKGQGEDDCISDNIRTIR